MNTEQLQTEQHRRFAEFARQERGENHKKHIGNALRGRVRPEIAESQTTSWKIVRPLVLRNGMSSEIAELTDFTTLQISRMISQPRTVLAVPEYKSRENKKERHTRKTQNRIKSSQQISLEERENKFAKTLIKKGFIGDNVLFWNLSKGFAKETRSNWFNSFSLGLVVEAYLISRYQQSRGSDEMMKLYRLIGESVDKKWFNSKRMQRTREKLNSHLALKMSPSK